MTRNTMRAPRRTPRLRISGLVLVAPFAGAVFLAGCSEEQSLNPPTHVHSVASVSIVPSDFVLKIGENAAVAAEARCSCGDVVDATFTFASSDAGIATVNPDGVVTGVALGDATVSATAKAVTAAATVQVQARGTAIDKEGGTVHSADGNVELILPAAALDALTDVEIEPVDAGMLMGDPLYIAGTAYQLKPNGLQLRERAHLRIHYDPNLVPPGVFHEQLRLRERDREKNQWRETRQNQLQLQAMHGEIERFGVYALVIKPAIGTMIGPAGGLAVSADGNFELTIPPGALSEATDITVEKLDDSMFDGDPQFIAGTAYEVKPAGLQLQEQAQLRIHYNPDNVPSGMQVEQLRIRERDRQQNQWRDPSQCSNQQGAIETGVTTLGQYAIIGSGPKIPIVASIRVSPSMLEIEEGDVIRMLAVVLDTDGNALSVPVTWTSSNPPVAVVDQTGLVTAIAEGTVAINAEAGGVKGQAAATVSKRAIPASLTVVPASASVGVGGTIRLTAEVRDALGNLISQTVTWQSTAPSIATVSGGLVTGVAAGAATITARAENVWSTATITVNPPVSSVVISGSASDPLEVGETLQLIATAFDSNGQPVNWKVTWSSGDDGIATVDRTGLVAATGSGTATITAAAGSASASVDVRVVGETVTAGNNLSRPVVFAEGFGVTGLQTSVDPGIRPTAAEGIAVSGNSAFFYPGNTADYMGSIFTQQSENTWRAEWLDGSGATQDAQVDWGDNIVSHTWNTHAVIRVEVTLYAKSVPQLTGFNMFYLYGQGPTEMQGTDGTTGLFQPTVYSITPRLTIEKLDTLHNPIAGTVVFDGSVVDGLGVEGPGSYRAEVNVAGRIVYGYNLFVKDLTLPSNLHKYGWWRLTFSLLPEVTVAGVSVTRNTRLVELLDVAGLYVPVLDPSGTASSIDIWIDSASGGGGGGHSSGS